MRRIVKSRVVVLVLKEPTRSLQTRVKKARPPSEGHQRKDENTGTRKHDGAQWYGLAPNTQLCFKPKLAPVVRVLSGEECALGVRCFLADANSPITGWRISE